MLSYAVDDGKRTAIRVIACCCSSHSGLERNETRDRPINYGRRCEKYVHFVE